MQYTRVTAGFGIAAAFFTVAAAVAAPQASARELAPGVACAEKTCTNDTDDTYRVTSEVLCTGMGAPALVVEVKTYVPARGSAEVTAYCPSYTEPLTMEQQQPRLGPDGWEYPPPVSNPGQTHFRWLTRIDHKIAVVDNNPPARTGSFG